MDVVMVLEHYQDDQPQAMLVDPTKLNQNDPEEKEYYDAIQRALQDPHDSTQTSHWQVFHAQNQAAVVTTPAQVNVIGDITLYMD